MYVIGLTGGIGSGKTTVANLFAAKGITVIDTDQLARDVTQPGREALQKIAEKFGATILATDGTLNRSALRKHVFDHPEDRVWLEQLLHPLIRTEMKVQAEKATSPYCIVVIPLLFETTPNPLINRVLVIDATEEQQIQRTQARDNVARDDVTAILQTQLARQERLTKANDIIHNHGNKSELVAQVARLDDFYRGLARV